MMQRTIRATMLLLAGFALSAGSCDKQERIQKTIPPVADLKSEPAPSIPDTVFEVEEHAGRVEFTDEAIRAQGKLSTDRLVWGRRGWATVDRICRWAENLVGDIPEVDCPPSPVQEE